MRFAAGIDHFHAEFMTENSRVVKKWLLAGKRMEICPANTNAVNPDERFARCRFWFGRV